MFGNVPARPRTPVRTLLCHSLFPARASVASRSLHPRLPEVPSLSIPVPGTHATAPLSPSLLCVAGHLSPAPCLSVTAHAVNGLVTRPRVRSVQPLRFLCLQNRCLCMPILEENQEEADRSRQLLTILCSAS